MKQSETEILMKRHANITSESWLQTSDWINCSWWRVQHVTGTWVGWTSKHSYDQTWASNNITHHCRPMLHHSIIIISSSSSTSTDTWQVHTVMSQAAEPLRHVPPVLGTRSGVKLWNLLPLILDWTTKNCTFC